ncbi:MAG: hypothetical protein SFZ24_05620 [Planctomycetota bacterium]|nr:hypothetical protein [Planctomycetota bacterium]
MAQVCLVSPDLSRVVLADESSSEQWAAHALSPDADPVIALRERAAAAAEWVAAKSRRRLAAAVIDVDQAMCVWLKAPGTQEPVLAAALRASAQDWGDRFSAGSVQRLAKPEKLPAAPPFASLRGKKPAQAPEARGAAVLGMPVSLVRIWLDELDARGVRADAVLSLWHALALAWAAPGDAPAAPPLSAEIARRDDRLLWVWRRGPALVAGGSVFTGRTAEPAAAAEPPDTAQRTDSLERRLSLDWLSWAAQLGASPARIRLLGAEAAALRPGLAQRWPQAELAVEPAHDVVTQTLARLAAAPAAIDRDDPTLSLTSLSSRPTRAVRAQYRWAAAALVLLAGAIASVGHRFGRAAGALDGAEAEIRQQAVEIVANLDDPKLTQTRNMVKALESRLVELQRREPPKLPPAPKPIFQELRRLTEAVSRFEGATITQISFDSRANSVVQLSVPDRRTGEEIRLALQNAPGASINWTEQAGGGGDRALRLSGAWIR